MKVLPEEKIEKIYEALEAAVELVPNPDNDISNIDKSRLVDDLLAKVFDVFDITDVN